MIRICRGCGTSESDRAKHLANGSLNCCPERGMNEVIERDHGTPATVSVTERQRRVLTAVSPGPSGIWPRSDQIANWLVWPTTAVYGRLRALERKGLVERIALAGNVFRWRRV